MRATPNGVVRNTLLALFCAVLGAGECLAANDKKQDQRKREEERERRELRKDQDRLQALERAEAALKNEVDRLEKHLPALKARADQADVNARDLVKELASTRSSSESADQAVKTARLALAELTKQIEDSQSASSEFGKSRDAHRAARDAWAKAVDEAEAAPGYKNAREQAMAAANRALAIPEIRKQWIDQNPNVVEAKKRLDETKGRYGELLDALLKGNPQWAKLSAQAAEAAQKDRNFDQQLHSTATQSAKAVREAGVSRAELKAAEARLGQCRGELRRIPNQKDAIRKEIERDRRELRDPRR